ncbi:putative transmembrane protein adipocyte-associated 1 [Medicago truncatula]|uniref:Putative transmembrane protein adipocyte-associated 1 n=1 Tax=Medicago truncatula TaxID=3880 RepID=I3SZ53_MEDTR|nr:protein CANDIDATE G-PROTEIN COUPLED RECEPTOR 2 [Medicago truncatula]AFK45545.1 unknown [Medicago truncatula]KEH43059.1 transmembrane protein, putative [Medicago truncatula]RHN80713.1 putative transmembrane protein adipocyte-associated 1 [Medicago truncatula]
MVEKSVLSITNEDSSSSSGVLTKGFTDWVFECHGFWHNAVLIIASFLFVLYLAFQARKSFYKLTNGRSYIIISYYASLWLVSILNLAWCFSQAWECTPGKELTWNLLSLFTSSGMLFLEVSLLAFLLQGNNASGVEALTRTFGISGIIVGFDVLLKAIYLFAFGVPLFIDTDHGTPRLKWNLWVIHKLVLTVVYGLILFMYHSRWRERLPARPAFYKYVIIMFILNAIALFACGLTGNGAGFGFWFYHVTIVSYHAFYLPLLYITFLADFFQEEDFHMENVYYSEMKDAGFFESDWE